MKVNSQMKSQAIIISSVLLVGLTGALAGPARKTHSQWGIDTDATVINPTLSETTLTGYVRSGYLTLPPGDPWPRPKNGKPIPYLYLHLDKPVDVFSSKANELHQYDIQLFSYHSDVIPKLGATVGKKVTVRGLFPRTEGAATGVPLALSIIVQSIKVDH